MRFTHFLGAIFAGRFLRFCILSILVIRYGPQIVGFFGSVVHNHARLAIAIIAAAALIGCSLAATLTSTPLTFSNFPSASKNRLESPFAAKRSRASFSVADRKSTRLNSSHLGI